MGLSMEQFEFARAVKLGFFQFRLRAETEAQLPQFKGSTIRGALGMALKRTVCIRKDLNCDICLVRSCCIYTHLFETLPPEGLKYFLGQKHAPRPFVLEPTLEDKQLYAPGEELIFGLTLIGRTIDYLPYIIFAVDRAGQKGLGRGRNRFVLESVYSREIEGKERLVYLGADKSFSSGPFSLNTKEIIDQRLALFEPSTAEPSNLKLKFLTPTRIRVRNDLQSNVTFELLIKNILRRISQLTTIHCGFESPLDHRSLVERARNVNIVSNHLKWKDWERYSNRQQTKMNFGGLVGELEFTGPIAEFLPLLALGELLHIGTGTTMGLGKFQATIVDEPSIEAKNNHSC
jgi:hypothetical protein